MRSRTSKLSALLITGTLILTLATGCGKRVGSMVDPNDQPSEPPVQVTPDPLPSDPVPQPTPPGTDPYPGNPSVPNNPSAQLVAHGEVVKNGVIFGLGSIVVKVTVINPTAYSLSGEVTVSFTNGGKPTTEVASERVTLMPNETITRYFENSKWSLDGATVTVKTDAPTASNGTPYQNPYQNGYYGY